MNKRQLKKKGFLPCHGFEGPCKSRRATLRRQNTQFPDEEMNWVVACDQCFRVIDGYWAEQWAEYYSMTRSMTR